MGCEFGQGDEWNGSDVLHWYVLDFPYHQGIHRLVRDLNALYTGCPALHRVDFEWQGFDWIDCHDAQNSVLIFLRKDGDRFVVVALNFTPVPREGYRIGVPEAGRYRELFNSDSADYAGSGMGNAAGLLETEEVPWMNRPHSLTVTLPPLAGIVLGLEPKLEDKTLDRELVPAAGPLQLLAGGPGGDRA